MMALAICPAPFQSKSKKKADQKKDVKTASVHAVVSSNILQQLSAAPRVVELEEPIVRSLPPSRCSPPTSQCSPPASQHARSGSARATHASPSVGTGSHYSRHNQPDSHFECPNESQHSVASRCTRASSGYQSDEGTFESKMLSRATKERPANLRMTAARDYNPCCGEELRVKRGQRIQVLYRDQDWVFAMTKSGESGYVPYIYVRPSRKYGGYQSEPEYTQELDYPSGYDTDIPAGRQRVGAGHRNQIGDVYPASSVHQGFDGSGGAFRRVGSGSPNTARKSSVDGYLSAVEEYPSSYMQQPRPAKSLHSIIDSSSPKGYRPLEEKPDVDSFVKAFIEELVVIHTFDAKEEDEIAVTKGQKVKVLNADDPFWLWIMSSSGEGFIPRSCCSLGNHPQLHSNSTRASKAQTSPTVAAAGGRRSHRYYQYQQAKVRQAREQARHRFNELAKLRNGNPEAMNKDEICKTGSRLIVLSDYSPAEKDELEVLFGETLISNILVQNGAERLWAYSFRTDRCGFIPASIVAPQVVV